MDGFVLLVVLWALGFLGVLVYGVCVILRAGSEWDRITEGDYR